MKSETNPLLVESETHWPALDAVRAEHVAPALRNILGRAGEDLDALERALEDSSARTARERYGEIIPAIEQIGDRLAVPWGIVGQLLATKNSDALREAHQSVQPDVVAFGTRLGQSQPIYRALAGLAEALDFDALSPAERRVVEVLLRDARLAGVGLSEAGRERFGNIESELAELGTRFSNQLLDATKRYALLLRDDADIDGLPESWRGLAAQSAAEAGEAGASAEQGPWRVTLDAPSLIPFLTHARRRDLRETLYRAYITRASEGDVDNQPLIEAILTLRREQAHLLGFESYAEYSLAAKMAPNVDAVVELLETLRGASWQAAERDLRELRELATEAGTDEATELMPWDIAFWSERLRERRFSYSEEELRPYFPLPVVLDGLFRTAEELFGVAIRPADGEVPVYHRDLRFFRVYSEKNEAIAAFFLDPYARPGEKRGGAWMADCVGRRRFASGKSRAPVAFLVCNQTPPVGEKPSLMTFDEVTTLFHEFGHGLQHMLTEIDNSLVSGIQQVEWDAVELPSQFMENWCYERSVMDRVSGHFESGDPLPNGLFEKLRAARTFRAGSDMLRQLYFGLTDLELHHRFVPGENETAFDVQRRVAERTTVIPPLPEDRFLCSFSHIFGGGYAAGYYSYKWAEVLSADAFAAFEEAGLDDATTRSKIGRRFRDTVLARGGSQAPGEVYRDFRGRDPDPEALLRHSGLL